MASAKPVVLQKQGKRGWEETEAAFPEMRSFRDYFLGVILKPRLTFNALVSDSRRLKFGTLAVLIPAIGYTLFSAVRRWCSGRWRSHHTRSHPCGCGLCYSHSSVRISCCGLL